MNDDDTKEERGSAHPAAWVAAGVVVLPFVPLVLAGLEFMIFRTMHVENFCRKIGIHEALDKIYDPIFTFVRKVLHR